MKISSGAINFSTIPNQVKKLITSIREHTKNGLASKITSVKNTHASLNEKLKTGKSSSIEFALPQKIKDFFQPKDKNTLNKTLITVKNIKDTNNAGKKNISAEDVSKMNAAFMRKHIANQTCDYNYRMTGAARSPVESLYQPITGPRFLKVEHHQYPPPSHFRLRLPRHHLPTGLRNSRMQFYDRKPEKPLRPQIAIFQTQISVILHSAKYCPPASWSETAKLLRGSTFQIQNLLILIYLIYILTNADSLTRH
ncbi:E3 ubiquitin-protein ligase SopA [Salmonella enterica subsp. enterica serovar Braenderup]|nr:E3 ubiquitin-protein ligase SopA [Salmonella enterica subsp. enterica serovar Braenderup]